MELLAISYVRHLPVNSYTLHFVVVMHGSRCRKADSVAHSYLSFKIITVLCFKNEEVVSWKQCQPFGAYNSIFLKEDESLNLVEKEFD